MDIKEIIKDIEKTLTDRGLKYFIVTYDDKSENIGALCNISGYILSQVLANVMVQDERIVFPIEFALKCYKETFLNDNA